MNQGKLGGYPMGTGRPLNCEEIQRLLTHHAPTSFQVFARGTDAAGWFVIVVLFEDGNVVMNDELDTPHASRDEALQYGLSVAMCAFSQQMGHYDRVPIEN